MRLTNRFNLPEELYQAVQHFHSKYKKVGDFSITGLLKPAYMARLQEEKDDEIEVDASDMLYRLMGQAIHQVLEKYETTTSLTEERLVMEIDVDGKTWIVSGQPDVVFQAADGTVSVKDWKFASIGQAKLSKPEYEAQLNMQAELVRRNLGVEPNALRNCNLLRDHFKTRVGFESEYPEIAYIEHRPKAWESERVLDFMRDRIRAHAAARQGAIEDQPVCSPEERWTRPTKYAVMALDKNGEIKKRAVRVFADEAEAQKMIDARLDAGLKDYVLQVRRGSDLRCELYCDARMVCPFGRALVVTAEEGVEA